MNAEEALAAGKPIILFDGVCNFCNGWVNLLLRLDSGDVFRFAALQSAAGEELLRRAGRHQHNLDTFILIHGDAVYDRSTAFLEVCRLLGGIFRLLLILRLMPRPVRDWLYDLVARNRYRFFGKRESCVLPTDAVRVRFLV